MRLMRAGLGAFFSADAFVLRTAEQAEQIQQDVAEADRYFAEILPLVSGQSRCVSRWRPGRDAARIYDATGENVRPSRAARIPPRRRRLSDRKACARLLPPRQKIDRWRRKSSSEQEISIASISSETTLGILAIIAVLSVGVSM